MNSHAHVKRPMNCFMVWSREKRYRILQEHPGINNAEVSKALGAAWRKLSQEDKEPYVEEARRLTEQHKVEHPGYKYQPKRSNSKRIRRGAQKKVIKSTKHYSKSNQRISTGEKIHFPLNTEHVVAEFVKPSKQEIRSQLCFPPHSGSVQCFPSPGFQTSTLRFCPCHVFCTSSPCHPALAIESIAPSNQFFRFENSSFFLYPYAF